MYDKGDVTIYGIRCKANGKMYVGRSGALESRIRSHLTDLRAGRKKGRDQNGRITKADIQLDYDKFGESAFEVVVLEENVGYLEGLRREKFWIEEYQTTDPRYGYNRRAEKHTGRTIPIVRELPPKPKRGE